MLAHGRRNADAAGLGQGLQPCGNIDRVTEQITAPDHDIAEMDADAEQHPPFGPQILVLFGDCRLDDERARERFGNARKLREHRVAGSVGDAPPVPGD
jgi:hypothetical protein